MTPCDESINNLNYTKSFCTQNLFKLKSEKKIKILLMSAKCTIIECVCTEVYVHTFIKLIYNILYYESTHFSSFLPGFINVMVITWKYSESCVDKKHKTFRDIFTYSLFVSWSGSKVNCYVKLSKYFFTLLRCHVIRAWLLIGCQERVAPRPLLWMFRLQKHFIKTRIGECFSIYTIFLLRSCSLLRFEKSITSKASEGAFSIK